VSNDDLSIALRTLAHDLASPLQIVTSCLEAMSFTIEQLEEVVRRADAASATELTDGLDRVSLADMPDATRGARNGLSRLVDVLDQLEELVRDRKAA
jgi:K+-sensing histidine kinase KdpD